MDKIIATLKALVLKEGGKISWTKVLTYITASLATLIALPDMFAQAGIALPAFIVPWIKTAGILSAVITMLRVKWNIENSKGSPNA